MTARLLAAKMGRPSIAGLTDSLDRARRVNGELRSLLRTERHESRAFAEVVRAHASRVHLAVVAERPDLCLQDAAAILALAERHLRQRGGEAA